MTGRVVGTVAARRLEPLFGEWGGTRRHPYVDRLTVEALASDAAPRPRGAWLLLGVGFGRRTGVVEGE